MELIQQLVQQLGVSDQQAKGGAGLIMGAVKSQLGRTDYSKVKSAIPEADELISAAPADSGIGSTLCGLVSSLNGGDSNLSTLAGLARGFAKLNLDSDMIGQFVPVVLSFVQSKGDDTAENLIAGVLK